MRASALLIGKGKNMARVSVMYSGSSGNCTLVSSGSTSVLIDAGVSAKRICDGLIERDNDIKNICGIFITHAHIDHIKGINVLLKKNKIPIYITNGTYNEAIQQGLNADDGLINIIRAGDMLELEDMQICPFNTLHDAAESVGYTFRLNEGRRIGYATDLGVVTNEVENALTGCDFVIIESNHDINMLKNGSYPYVLKKRILSQNGHLSNKDCANEAVKLAALGATRFVLSHISRENNLPSLAFAETANALNARGLQEGTDYLLECAPQMGGRIHIF